MHWMLIATTTMMLHGVVIPPVTYYEVPTKETCQFNERRFKGLLHCVQMTDVEIAKVQYIKLRVATGVSVRNRQVRILTR